jgi:AcrR family transcriptional regulator
VGNGQGDGSDAYPDADLAAVQDEAPPSARVALSRERIVAAALAYIDAHGLPGLTMRRLGVELGVEAMALYRYVPSKEDLLDAVVESLVAGVRADEVVLDAPQDGWQDFLQRLAHGVRRMALAHPKAFPLVASRPAEAPWLRPPLRSLEVVETFLSGLLEEGFSDTAAVEGYRAYTSFLLGHLLLEVAVHGADVGPLDVLDDQTGEPGITRHPTVARLHGPLSEDRSAVEFEEALEALIDRMTLTRNEHLEVDPS